MQHSEHSPKFIRQRRFLTVLPLLILPFITFMFWALGGGKTDHANAQTTRAGFNMQLPGAHLKDDKPQDKLSYYEQAAADSLKLQQQIKNDPYYHVPGTMDTPVHPSGDALAVPADAAGAGKGGKAGQLYTDQEEAQVYRKLARLNAAINKPDSVRQSAGKEEPVTPLPASSNNPDAERLEQMMNAMGQKEEPDPEIQQLNGMLGKILDIQHPALVQERIREQSAAKRGIVLPVTAKGENDPVSLIQSSTATSIAPDSSQVPVLRQNAFYTIDDETGSDAQNAIEAVIHETQTLVNGSTVKLRLLNDVYINGALIPANSFVFGAAQLNGERLAVKISGIRYRNSLFPVELSVYDMDGMSGIYIPGAISRDVAKESTDRSLQEVSFAPVDPSIGAQAASAGIQAATTLFSKKVKLIKVTVKAGYHVLLRDEKQKQNN